MEKLKSIIITGGAGFIGGYAVRYYLDKGYHVFSLDKDEEAINKQRSVYGLENYTADKINIVNKDALLRSFWYIYNFCQQNDIEEPEFVLHLAGDPDLRKSVKDPISSANDNIMGTISLLEVMREIGIKKIAFASSGSVYGETKAAHIDDICEPASPYAASKYCCEQYMKCYELLHGFKPTCFRFFNVVGAGGKEGNVVPIWIKRGFNGEPLIVNGDGTITRDYIACEDLIMLIDSIMHIEDRKFKYNLGYGKSTSLNELTELIKKGLGEIGDKVTVEYGPAKAGDVHDSVAVIDETVAKLLKEKAIYLEEGINNTAKAIFWRDYAE
jgi:nucleoside-diphosphate-sugar epimerase